MFYFIAFETQFFRNVSKFGRNESKSINFQKNSIVMFKETKCFSGKLGDVENIFNTSKGISIHAIYFKSEGTIENIHINPKCLNKIQNYNDNFTSNDQELNNSTDDNHNNKDNETNNTINDMELLFDYYVINYICDSIDFILENDFVFVFNNNESNINKTQCLMIDFFDKRNTIYYKRTNQSQLYKGDFLINEEGSKTINHGLFHIKYQSNNFTDNKGIKDIIYTNSSLTQFGTIYKENEYIEYSKTRSNSNDDSDDSDDDGLSDNELTLILTICGFVVPVLAICGIVCCILFCDSCYCCHDCCDDCCDSVCEIFEICFCCGCGCNCGDCFCCNCNCCYSRVYGY